MHTDVVPKLIPIPVNYDFFEKGRTTIVRRRRSNHTLKVFSGAPEPVIEISPAYCIPPFVCIYDKDGRRVPESCVRRGAGLDPLPTSGSEQIILNRDFERIDRPSVFLSCLIDHWGHFLTEGISRLWAFDLYPELKKYLPFYVRGRVHAPHVRQFFRMAGLNPDKLLSLKPAREVREVLHPACFFFKQS